MGKSKHKEYVSCKRKFRYRTVGDVHKGISHIRRKRPDEYLDYYWCPICKGYHLTSKEFINDL